MTSFQTKAPSDAAPLSAVGAPSPKAPSGQNGEIFCYIFVLLLEAMDTRQQSVSIQAKELANYAADEQEQDSINSKLKFAQIPSNATQGKIDQIQDENEAIAAQRADVQNVLITLRQQSQVLMTQTNTNVDTLEQDASMNSGMLKTLQTIFQVINQINGGA